MTEIPEHLLKRSKAARNKAAGDDASDDSGAAAAPAAATPAKVAAAAPPVVAEEKPPPPPSPMVQAYESRRKIPWWALSVLAFIPLWAYVYQATLEPPPGGEGPAVLGEEFYASNACAGCHGAGGGGGSGPAFTGGEIYETWPNFVDHFEWVRLGSVGYADAGNTTYGANAKPIGTGMPGFNRETISDAELIYIILHERELGGENPSTEDHDLLELVAEYLFEHDDKTLAEALAEVGYEGNVPEVAQGE